MAAPVPSREDAVREHQIFWMLVKGSRDRPVGRVHLAIQAAIAYGAARLDVGWLMGEMMAQGRQTTGPAGEDIGAGGLAYFHWLYEVELVGEGAADCHEYRFRRRADGKEVLASLQTGVHPRSLRFQQDYERTRRKLEQKRARFLGGPRRQAADGG